MGQVIVCIRINFQISTTTTKIGGVAKTATAAAQIGKNIKI